MISGDRPSGYIATSDEKCFAETRQCVHCQYTWIYIPGSGAKRGICLKCYGLLCGRPECMRLCDEKHAPFSEANQDARYRMTPGGVMLPVNDYNEIYSRIAA